MSKARTRLNALPISHPRVFAAGQLTWGFEHGDGWCELLGTLCEVVDSMLSENPEATISTLQVKEKFGSLRFYYRCHNVSEDLAMRIRNAVHLAEKSSSHICERCAARHASDTWPDEDTLLGLRRTQLLKRSL